MWKTQCVNFSFIRDLTVIVPGGINGCFCIRAGLSRRDVW